MTTVDGPLPETFYDALVEYLNTLDTQEAKETKNQGQLWLAASWKQAQAMGLSEREYGRWIRAGYWNIAGDPSSARAIETYRALAGRRGHLIALAGITPEAAVEQAKANGIAALLQGCEAVIALLDLSGDILDEEPEIVEPQQRTKIDFS